MTEHLRYDSVRVRAEVTPEGYLKDSPIVARAGVQEYRRLDGTIRREYRPPEVVFDSASLAGMAGIPIIDTHIGMMNAENVRKHAVGTVLSSGRQDGEHVVADIVIHDPTPVVKHNRKELSLAYTVRCDETPGTTPDGKPYDARVIAITGYNHLAIVERGRAGVARLRLDSEDAISSDIQDVEIIQREDESEMNTQPANGGAPQSPPQPNGRHMVQVRVDGGLEYPAAPEVEHYIRSLNAKLTDANKRADTAEAERDAAKQQIAQHDSQIQQVRADTANQIRTRIALESSAKEIGVDIRADASDRAIREDVIRKVDGEPALRFDGKSDDYIAALFDKAIERHAANKKQNDTNRAAINGVQIAPRADGVIVPVAGTPGAPVINSARAARDIMARRGRL